MSNRLQDIIQRIASGEYSETERAALKQALLNDEEQTLNQLGRYNIYIGEGENIQIGDRIYVEINDAAVQAIVEKIQKQSAWSPQIIRFLRKQTHKQLNDFHEILGFHIHKLLQNTACVRIFSLSGSLIIAITIVPFAARPLIEKPLRNSGLDAATKSGIRLRGLPFHEFLLPDTSSKVTERLQGGLMNSTSLKELEKTILEGDLIIKSVSAGTAGNLFVAIHGDRTECWNLKEWRTEEKESIECAENIYSYGRSISDNFIVHLARFNPSSEHSEILASLGKSKEERYLLVSEISETGGEIEKKCLISDEEELIYQEIVAIDTMGEYLGFPIRLLADSEIKISETEILATTPGRDILIYKLLERGELDPSCRPYTVLPIQGEFVNDIDFWPRKDGDNLILALSTNKNLHFWKIEESGSERIELPSEWKEDYSLPGKCSEQVAQDDRVVQIGQVAKLKFSPDGDFLVTIHKSQYEEREIINTLRIWKFSTRVSERSPQIEIQKIGEISLVDKHHEANITSLTTGKIKDKQFLAVGDERGDVKLWTIPNCTNLGEFSLHGEEVSTIDVYPEGQVLISGGRDGNVKLLDLETLTLPLYDLLRRAR